MSKKRFLAGLSGEALDALTLMGRNIAEARKARGLSQREMAQRCLMALSTYQAIERGSPEVSIGAVTAALDLLDMTDGLQELAAPHHDPVGVSVRAGKRRY